MGSANNEVTTPPPETQAQSEIDLARDPRDMTDDELRADIKALESRLYTLKAEGVKIWRLRLRIGQGTEADEVRMKELLKRRAGKDGNKDAEWQRHRS